MKYKLLGIVLLAAGIMVLTGCQTQKAHERYRRHNWRMSENAYQQGLADDIDAVLLLDRPTHLSPWFHE